MARRFSCATCRGVIYAALLGVLSACAEPPAEEQLRATIDEMQAAAIERRPSEFMDRVTEDFIGDNGIDRAALHNLLRAQLLRNAAVSATRGPIDIELQGERATERSEGVRAQRATVRFTIVLTGGSGGLLPERAQGYAITSGWRVEDGEWRLFLAEWKPAL